MFEKSKNFPKSRFLAKSLLVLLTGYIAYSAGHAIGISLSTDNKKLVSRGYFEQRKIFGSRTAQHFEEATPEGDVPTLLEET
jgi:hypothetical protein